MPRLTLASLLPFTIALILAPALLAQTAGPTAEQLKSWIAIRQQRVDLLRDEIKQSDAHIESRIDLIIDTLTSITDSKDSRTKVARMKEDTMKRLGRTIQDYDRRRATFREDLRRPTTPLSEADKKKVIAAFDARIEKRTRQIIALKQSMPAAKDYDRYEVSPGGWTGTTVERNRDFEQNRRMSSHSDTQRDALGKQLDASIARLDRLGRDLRSQLAATTDPAARRERESEIARNDALIAERRQQKLELMKPSDRAARTVSLKEAVDLDQNMRKAVDELRRDVTTFFQRYNTLVAELSALRTTEAALAARQAK